MISSVTKVLLSKTIKMLIASPRESHSLMLIYELPTFKEQDASDRGVQRFSGGCNTFNSLWESERVRGEELRA